MNLRIFCILGLALVVLFPIGVEANSYKVTPRIIDREVEPRDIFSETVTITNNLSYKLLIYPTVNVVSVDAGGDITEFTTPSMADNTVTISSWIQISRGRQEIEPGATLDIPVYFKIHPEAKPGVYHALIGFGSGSNRPEAERKVRDGVAPGVIVTLSIGQEQNEFLKLSQFIVDRFVTSPENDAIHYTLSNPGDAPVIPKGEIIFYNSRGEEVAAIPVNPNGDSLAPGQESAYSTAAPVADMLGKYKAFLSVDYGTTQLASVYDTAFFYVMPWQKLLIIFVSVLSLAVIITVLLHRRFGGGDVDDEDAEYVPVFVRDTRSEDKEHDIDLRKK